MSTIKKSNVRDKVLILYALHLLGATCYKRSISGSLIQVIQEIDTQTNELW